MPTRVEVFGVRLGYADAGWLDVHVLAGHSAFTFATSYVFDPYPDLLAWLERIADGGASSVAVDTEGSMIYLGATVAPGRDNLRFSVIHAHHGAGNGYARELSIKKADFFQTLELKCDVVIDRRAFVAGCYRGVQEGWELPDKQSFWERWYNTPLSEWEDRFDNTWEQTIYSVNSAVIDRYLSR